MWSFCSTAPPEVHIIRTGSFRLTRQTSQCSSQFLAKYELLKVVVAIVSPLITYFQLNEEAGYKSAIAGSIFPDFAWHLKWSREEKKLLSLSHYKPLPIHIFIGLTVQKSKKKYP